MRASLLLVPLLLSCGGGSSKSTAGTKPNAPEVTGKGSRGFDEHPEDYGADEYGEFGYDDGYYGEGYGGDYYGGEGYQDEPYVPPAPTPPALSGTWHGACAAGAKDSHKLTFVMTTLRWDLSYETYADTTCAKRTTLVQVGGPYTIGEQSTDVPTAWNATFSFDTRDLTVDDAKTAKSIGKTCAIKKLKAGTAVSVLDKGCAKLGWKPLAACAGEFDLVSVTGTRLQLGARAADNDLCTVGKRPTALDTATYAYEWPASGIPECDAAYATLDRYMNCPMVAQYLTGDVMTQVKEQLASFKDAASCKSYDDALAQGLSSMGC